MIIPAYEGLCVYSLNTENAPSTLPALKAKTDKVPILTRFPFEGPGSVMGVWETKNKYVKNQKPNQTKTMASGTMKKRNWLIGEKVCV